ncbi:MAG: hypothetical protein GKS06_13575 [Acidobacteria bacterium]|nr:hypothetical protein [Acidobacteriota bacterium]
MRIAILLFAAAMVAPSTPVLAEVHAVEVVLFMPCNEETAAAAIAALRQVPGVEEVHAAAGDLRVRALVGDGFETHPLGLVQMLWDMKLFPNRIFVEATVVNLHLEDGREVRIAGTPHRFAVTGGPSEHVAGARPIWLRAEVLDWIEDEGPDVNSPYSLRVIESQDTPDS